MALELTLGPVFGLALTELFKVVLDVNKKSSNFEPMIKRLEKMLRVVIPRLDEISCFNQKLNLRQEEMDDLLLLLKNGKTLLVKCSNISPYNFVKIKKYSNKLKELENELLRHFTFILSLDQTRDNKEILSIVRKMHMKLSGDEQNGLNDLGCFNDDAKDGEPKMESGSEGTSEVLKVLRDLSTKLYGQTSSDDWAGDFVYRNKDGKCLFLLKGYPNDLDLADLLNCECKPLDNRQSTLTTFMFKVKSGYVVLKTLSPDLKMNNNEFRQRMEEIGKIGTHPNIILPFGYICSGFHRFLLYDYSAKGSFEKHLTESESIDVRTRQDWDSKLKIVLGIAKGINYMHSQWGVVHGNIKSSNIFLTRDLNGCISDFGFDPTMHLPKTASPETSPGKLVPKCSAPELNLTKEADVYNFGVMLFEIRSLYGYHLLWHPNVLTERDQIAQIARKCANKDQEKRPKMGDVVKMIQKVISKEDI